MEAEPTDKHPMFSATGESAFWLTIRGAWVGPQRARLRREVVLEVRNR